MARESKYQTRWRDTTNGGVIKRMHFREWLARPSNCLGTLEIRSFDTEAEAIKYADSELRKAA